MQMLRPQNKAACASTKTVVVARIVVVVVVLVVVVVVVVVMEEEVVVVAAVRFSAADHSLSPGGTAKALLRARQNQLRVRPKLIEASCPGMSSATKIWTSGSRFGMRVGVILVLLLFQLSFDSALRFFL